MVDWESLVTVTWDGSDAASWGGGRVGLMGRQNAATGAEATMILEAYAALKRRSATASTHL